MEKTRLNLRIKMLLKWYLVVGNIAFFIWVVLASAMMISHENIDNYCLEAEPLLIDKWITNMGDCKIDWLQLAGAPVMVFSIVYLILFVPIAMIYRFLKQ